MCGYKAPKLILKPRRAGEITFVDTIPALTQRTLLSPKLPYPFRVSMVTMRFASDHIDNVQHYWLASLNATVSTTSVPPDTNIFGQSAALAYFIGDNEEIKRYPNFEWREASGYVKLHINNLNTYGVVVNCSALVEEI